MFKYVFVLLVLVVGLAGAGYYNYQRNAAMDSDLQENRPYRAVPNADLAKIIASTQQDIARRKGADRLGAAGRVEHRRDGLERRRRQGQRVRGLSARERAWKNKRAAVMEQEALLKELSTRRSSATKDLDPMSRIKRRVLTF